MFAIGEKLENFAIFGTNFLAQIFGHNFYTSE